MNYLPTATTIDWSNWLLRTSLEGTVLILFVLTLMALLGQRLNPRWRVLLWTAVGLKLLVPAFIPLQPGLGSWTLPGVPSPHQAHPQRETPPPYRFIEEALPITADSARNQQPIHTAAAHITTSSIWLLVIWLAGVVTLVGICGIRHLRFLRQFALLPCRDPDLLNSVREISRDHGIRREIEVISVRNGTAPAVFGLFRPRLIVPLDWKTRLDEPKLRHVLRHEIEHLRRCDLLWNWAAAVVNALHWFNPLVWVAVSRFQSDRELLCDQNTISRLGLIFTHKCRSLRC